MSQQIFEGLLDDFLMESRERTGRVEELLLTIAQAQESSAPEEMEPAIASVRVPFSALDDLMDLLAEMVIFRNRLGDAIFRGHAADRGNRIWRTSSRPKRP